MIGKQTGQVPLTSVVTATGGRFMRGRAIMQRTTITSINQVNQVEQELQQLLSSNY